MQQQAFKDLITIKNANAGSLSYGDIASIVNDYRGSGYKEVSTHNLRHRLKYFTKTGSMILPSEQKLASNLNICSTPLAPTTIANNSCTTGNDNVDDASVVSSLTTTRNEVVTVNVSVNHTQDGLDNTEILVQQKVRNKGGRKTGSTNKAMDERDQALKDAIAKVATEFYNAREKSNKVAPHTLADLIKKTAAEYNVPEKNSKENNHIKS
jgi:hypothetical protein